MKTTILFFAFIATITTGCYRMPEDGALCTKPLTNNPQVVSQRGPDIMPGMNY